MRQIHDYRNNKSQNYFENKTYILSSIIIMKSFSHHMESVSFDRFQIV